MAQNGGLAPGGDQDRIVEVGELRRIGNIKPEPGRGDLRMFKFVRLKLI